MKIESDLMLAIRSGCSLGRMAETEVEAIIEHLEKLGWTPPAPKTPVAAAPSPAVSVVNGSIPVPHAPVAPVAPVASAPPPVVAAVAK